MEVGVMPNEVIARCDREQLTVQWSPKGDLDPMVGVGSWRETLDPNGSHADWEPVGPQWALEVEGLDRMIRALRRAKRAIYPQQPPPQPINLTLNISGQELTEDKLRDLLMQNIRRYGRGM
jgi:hypothetical protein